MTMNSYGCWSSPPSSDLAIITRSRSGPSEEAKKWQDAKSTEDKNEAFWGKLKSTAERKVGAAEAERFCQAFQQVYKKLVYEELTLNSRNS